MRDGPVRVGFALGGRVLRRGHSVQVDCGNRLRRSMETRLGIDVQSLAFQAGRLAGLFKYHFHPLAGVAHFRGLAVREQLDSLEGVDVHQHDPASGRIIITLEAEDVTGEVEGLKRIKALPDIVLAEMVYHFFEDDRQPVSALPPELEEVDGLDRVQVPATLRD